MSDVQDIERAERLAIASEPALPAPGSPERERLDKAHRWLVAALIAAYWRYRQVRT